VSSIRQGDSNSRSSCELAGFQVLPDTYDTVTFDARNQWQRISLVLSGNNVVFGFGALELESTAHLYSGWGHSLRQQHACADWHFRDRDQQARQVLRLDVARGGRRRTAEGDRRTGCEVLSRQLHRGAATLRPYFLAEKLPPQGDLVPRTPADPRPGRAAPRKFNISFQDHPAP
jgi:hypothetical protein